MHFIHSGGQDILSPMWKSRLRISSQCGHFSLWDIMYPGVDHGVLWLQIGFCVQNQTSFWERKGFMNGPPADLSIKCSFKTVHWEGNAWWATPGWCMWTHLTNVCYSRYPLPHLVPECFSFFFGSFCFNCRSLSSDICLFLEDRFHYWTKYHIKKKNHHLSKHWVLKH